MNLYPSWKQILTVFGLLIALLLGYFAWQFQRINLRFREHSLEHSTILSAAVELNIRNAIASHRATDAIIKDSLNNTARFIAYLNQVEPFNAPELEAFAQESGLSGILIFDHTRSPLVKSPGDWLPPPASLEKPGLFLLTEAHMYLYILAPVQSAGVAVAMPSDHAERLQERLSVKRLLSRLNGMKGINYVRLEPKAAPPGQIAPPSTSLVQVDQRPVAETRIDMGERILVVGLEADFFLRRLDTLKKELWIFVSLLLLLGAVSSWWLYQVQQHRLQQTRNFERDMASQREQASLGRATATVAHEMRNPLNAISMGLQRMEMEVSGLEDEHRLLLSSMGQAVGRINGVITRLLSYVQAFKPGDETLGIRDLITPITALYAPQCRENGISMDVVLTPPDTVPGDSHYLSQAFENLIKNAVEARQRPGGFVKIRGAKHAHSYVITIENPCTIDESEPVSKYLAPYFTTKSNGTGIGLPISKKIIEAHSGTLHVTVQNKLFRVQVDLPGT